MARRWWMLGLLLITVSGCEDADRLARVCQKTAAKFDGVTERMRDRLQLGWGAVRGSVLEDSLESRVALRLRWDTDMQGAEVQVRLTDPGVIELSGVVADLPQRSRAVHLTQTTTGVESIRDRLTLASELDKP